MEKKYWIRINDENKGPYSMSELISRNANRDNYVWTEGFENWKKLEEVDDFINQKNQQIPQKSKSNILPIIIVFTVIIGFLFLYFIGKQLQKKNQENKEILTETTHSDINNNKIQENKSENLPTQNKTLIDELDKKYDIVTPFSEGIAGVTLNDKFGYVDEKGKEIISPQYDWGMNFSEGLAAVEKNNKWAYIDNNGEIIIPYGNYLSVRSFSGGLAAVEVSYKKWGFINKNGKLVIPAIYEDVRDFKNGFAGVGVNIEMVGIIGDYGFIDRSGKVIVPLIYQTIVKDFNNEDGFLMAELINKQGNKVWVGDDGKPAIWEE